MINSIFGVFFLVFKSLLKIGPLQYAVTWYGINYIGTQMTQWDFQNKGKSGWTGKSSFVLEVPLRHLRPSVIYSVPCDRILQRVYWGANETLWFCPENLGAMFDPQDLTTLVPRVSHLPAQAQRERWETLGTRLPFNVLWNETHFPAARNTNYVAHLRYKLAVSHNSRMCHPLLTPMSPID